VDWRAFFGVLADLKFQGHLFVEREAGNQRAKDVQTAREFVEQLAK
jgi:hypothetical protein